MILEHLIVSKPRRALIRALFDKRERVCINVFSVEHGISAFTVRKELQALIDLGLARFDATEREERRRDYYCATDHPAVEVLGALARLA